MSDRRFFGMFALAIVASFINIVDPKAAVAPVMMFFLLGFDEIARISKGEDR